MSPGPSALATPTAPAPKRTAAIAAIAASRHGRVMFPSSRPMVSRPIHPETHCNPLAAAVKTVFMAVFRGATGFASGLPRKGSHSRIPSLFFRGCRHRPLAGSLADILLVVVAEFFQGDVDHGAVFQFELDLPIGKSAELGRAVEAAAGVAPLAKFRGAGGPGLFGLLLAGGRLLLAFRFLLTLPSPRPRRRDRRRPLPARPPACRPAPCDQRFQVVPPGMEREDFAVAAHQDHHRNGGHGHAVILGSWNAWRPCCGSSSR